jgi:hypothetical protein
VARRNHLLVVVVVGSGKIGIVAIAVGVAVLIGGFMTGPVVPFLVCELSVKSGSEK